MCRRRNTFVFLCCRYLGPDCAVACGPGAQSLTNQSADGSWRDVNYNDQTKATWAAMEHWARMLVMVRRDASPHSPVARAAT